MKGRKMAIRIAMNKRFITNIDFLKSKDSTTYALWLQLHRKMLKDMYLIYLYFSTFRYSNLLN